MKIFIRIFTIVCAVIFCVVGAYYGHFRLTTTKYELSPLICSMALGVDPETFCETGGADTLLEGYYTYAKVDDADLILFLTDDEVDGWRNSCVQLQILQKYCGNERTIVTEVIPPEEEDILFKVLYEGVEECGFDVSDDFTKIVVGPGDDKSYFLVFPSACFLIQVINGKPSDEINVEYTVVDDQGNVTERLILSQEGVNHTKYEDN